MSLQIKIDPTAEQWLGIATRTRAWLRAIAGRLRHRRALTPDHAKGAAWSLRVLAKRIEDGERLTAEERGAVDILLRQHADRIEDTPPRGRGAPSKFNHAMAAAHVALLLETRPSMTERRAQEEVAEALGVTREAVRDAVKGHMEAARQFIAGLPR